MALSAERQSGCLSAGLLYWVTPCLDNARNKTAEKYFYQVLNCETN